MRNEDLSPDALQTARRAALGRWRAALSTDAGAAALIASQALLGRPPDAVRTDMQRIAAVTPEQVRAVAARYLETARLRLVLTGDPRVLSHAGDSNLGWVEATDSYGRVLR